MADLVDPPALDAERVLVDGDGAPILQQRRRLCADGAQIDRHEERRGEHAPDGHLGALLVPTQPVVTYQQLQPGSKLIHYQRLIFRQPQSHPKSNPNLSIKYAK